MNRAEEAKLAWTLIESATTLLSPQARAQLCVKVGAGDQDDAIVAVLELYARTRADMPTELATVVRTWVGGYRGADAEPFLRDLLDRIAPPTASDPTGSPASRVSKQQARTGDFVAR
jgi:hypothetical protein